MLSHNQKRRWLIECVLRFKAEGVEFESQLRQILFAHSTNFVLVITPAQVIICR